jgi:hypothetical protein
MTTTGRTTIARRSFAKTAPQRSHLCAFGSFLSVRHDAYRSDYEGTDEDDDHFNLRHNHQTMIIDVVAMSARSHLKKTSKILTFVSMRETSTAHFLFEAPENETD